MRTKSAIFGLAIGVMLAVGILTVAIGGQAASHKSLKLTPQVVPESLPCPTCARFGMVGITRGQTARLNVADTTNVMDTSDVPPGPCREVELMFFDSQGSIRQRSVQCLKPGHAAFLDLNGSFLEVPGLRAEIRASVNVIAPPPDPDRNRINLVATVEVFDNETGRTNFVLVATKGDKSTVDNPADTR